jgi:hypothetical protein
LRPSKSGGESRRATSQPTSGSAPCSPRFRPINVDGTKKRSRVQCSEGGAGSGSEGFGIGPTHRLEHSISSSQSEQ